MPFQETSGKHWLCSKKCWNLTLTQITDFLFGILFQKLINENGKLFHNNNT